MLFLPVGVRAPRAGARPLRDRLVPFATYDASHDAGRGRLVGLGAEARRAGTVQSTLEVARRRQCPAVVPGSAALTRPGERVRDLPWRHRITLDLLTPRTTDPAIVAAVPLLRRELGLSR